MKDKDLEGQYGFWSVYGEDSNCDFGGSHHMPLLGNFEGFYDDVLEHATKNMPRFSTWGSGGDVRPMKSSEKVTKIKSTREKKLERITGDVFSTAKVNKLFEDFKELNNKEKTDFNKKCLRYVNKT